MDPLLDPLWTPYGGLWRAEQTGRYGTVTNVCDRPPARRRPVDSLLSVRAYKALLGAYKALSLLGTASGPHPALGSIRGPQRHFQLVRRPTRGALVWRVREPIMDPVHAEASCASYACACV